jgi:hypothetical protein
MLEMDAYAAGLLGDAQHEVFHLRGCDVLVAEEDDAALGDCTHVSVYSDGNFYLQVGLTRHGKILYHLVIRLEQICDLDSRPMAGVRSL